MDNEELDLVLDIYKNKIDRLEAEVEYYCNMFQTAADQLEIVESYLYDNYGIVIEDILEEEEYDDC